MNSPFAQAVSGMNSPFAQAVSGMNSPFAQGVSEVPLAASVKQRGKVQWLFIKVFRFFLILSS